MATIMTLLANLLRVNARLLQAQGGRLPSWTKVEDFLPTVRPRPQQTPEQARAMVGLFLQSTGALN